MPKNTKNNPKKESKLSAAMPYIAAVLLLVVVAVAILFSGRTTDNDTERKPDPNNHDVTYAAWPTEDDAIVDEVEILSTGDTVKFVYDGQTIELPNTEVVYWNATDRSIDPNDYEEHYDYVITLPNNTSFEDIFFEYEEDPACQDSPGIIFWDDEFCYHVAKTSIKYQVHENTSTN